MATILIVDDDLRLLTALALVLRSEGYGVRTAATGDEALALLGQQPVDLIFADIMMPELDGYGLVGEQRRRGDVTPIILMSADGLAWCEHPCISALNKPFELDDLLGLVITTLTDGKISSSGTRPAGTVVRRGSHLLGTPHRACRCRAGLDPLGGHDDDGVAARAAVGCVA